VVTCKIKHLQNICKNVLQPSTSGGYAVDVKMLSDVLFNFLHVTTSYLQHVFNMLEHAKTFAKMFCKCFAIFLQMF